MATEQQGNAESRRREQSWFYVCKPTVETKLTLYEEPFKGLLLRAGDVEPVLETGIHRDILRHALANHAEVWADVPGLLRRSQSLSDVVVALFGEEVPLAVALTTLKELERDTETRAGMSAEVLAAEMESRGREVRDVGLPAFLWVVAVSKEGRMVVSVEERSGVDSRDLGLVKVVDVRRAETDTDEG